MHVFGWGEEAGVPIENMQTPHRKALVGVLNQKPSCYEGTVLTITTLCSPPLIQLSAT